MTKFLKKIVFGNRRASVPVLVTNEPAGLSTSTPCGQVSYQYVRLLTILALVFSVFSFVSGSFS